MGKSPKVKFLCATLVGLIVLTYLIFPYIAGLKQLGPDKRGPKFYFEAHHILLYTLGYESVMHEKPRISCDAGDRVWHYTPNKDKRR